MNHKKSRAVSSTNKFALQDEFPEKLYRLVKTVVTECILEECLP